MIDINNIILEEATILELKRELPIRKEKYLKTICAFANGATDGFLVIGIDDESKESIDLGDIDSIIQKMSNHIKNEIYPSLITNISVEEYKGNNVIIVKVSPGGHPPYFLKEGKASIPYIRNGNTTVVLEGDKLKELIMVGDNMTYDKYLTEHAYNELDFSTLGRYFRSIKKIEISEELLKSLELIKDGKVTRAGYLLSDSNKHNGSFVKAVRFKGLDKAAGHKEMKDFTGSLLTQYEKSLNFLMEHMKNEWNGKRDNLGGRIEEYEYIIDAVHECIVNALVHRDYLKLGSSINLFMFDDRLEISSEGLPYSGCSITELVENNISISTKRNPVIADVFNRLNLMERTGLGLHKVSKLYKDSGYKLPEFYEQLNFVFVKFYSNKHKNEKMLDLTKDERYTNLDKTNQSIINYIKENPGTVNPDIQKLTGLQKAAVNKRLKKLVDSKIIVIDDKKEPYKYSLM